MKSQYVPILDYSQEVFPLLAVRSKMGYVQCQYVCLIAVNHVDVGVLEHEHALPLYRLDPRCREMPLACRNDDDGEDYLTVNANYQHTTWEDTLYVITPSTTSASYP